MPRWAFYALVSDLLWGVWGIAYKEKTQAMSDQVMQVICTLGIVPTALLLLFSKNLKEGKNIPLGMSYAFVTGLCGSFGNLATLVALSKGGAAAAVYPIAGMFPLLTLVLVLVILRERPNAIQAVGFVIALVSIFLFNSGASLDVNLLLQNLTSGWMVYTLIAFVLYAIAGLTQKLSTNNITPRLSTIGFALGFIPTAVVILLTHKDLNWKITTKDWFVAVVWGSLIALAIIASFAAYRLGKASIVTPLTALYPAVIVFLAVAFYGEALTTQLVIAIVLALVAGVALCYEKAPLADPPNEPAAA